MQFENTTDVGTLGVLSADSTITVAPFGSLVESGLRFRLTGAVTRYTYVRDVERTNRVVGTDTSGEALLGYAFDGKLGSLFAAVGPSITQSVQKPQHAPALAETVSVGAKALASWFATPIRGTMFFLP